jgi:hypothetical protein
MMAKLERRRAEREARSTAPPDDGRVWLDAETVAIMLGASARRIRQLAAEDRLPCTRKGRRMWFLREYIEESALQGRSLSARTPARTPLSQGSARC